MPAPYLPLSFFVKNRRKIHVRSLVNQRFFHIFTTESSEITEIGFLCDLTALCGFIFFTIVEALSEDEGALFF